MYTHAVFEEELSRASSVLRSVLDVDLFIFEI